MKQRQLPLRRVLGAALVMTLAASLLLMSDAHASVTRTEGIGMNMSVSWTEQDPDDALGLPGNVHVGFLFADSGPYGTYVSGNVTNFECADGQVPFPPGGPVIIDDALNLAEDTADAIIEEAIETRASSLDLAAIGESIQDEIADEVPPIIIEEVACTYLGDLYLDGSETTTFTSSRSGRIANITGSLIVNEGNIDMPLPLPVADGGEEVPVSITLTGGEWSQFENLNKFRTATFAFSDYQKGMSFQNADVSGTIGDMAITDDNDTADGYYSKWNFKTTERLDG